MIIFRYITKEVLATLFAAVLILLLVFITNEFVNMLRQAADGKITVEAVLKLMPLQVPLLLGYLLPMSLFLGILLTVGRFCVDHEMIALWSCGVSRMQIVIMLIGLATVIMGIVAWVMLSVEPKMQRYRVAVLNEAAAQASLAKIVPGRFQVLGNDGKVFYAAGINKPHAAMGPVFVAQKQTSSSQDTQRWDIVSADFAKEVTVPNNGRFVLFKNGRRYMGAPGQLKFDAVQFDQYGMRLSISASNLGYRVEAMPTRVLWHMTDLNAVAELQWRLMMPLSVISLGLLAVPISYVNPRKGKFAQLLIAVLLYVVYANVMFTSRAFLESGKINRHWGLWWIQAVILLLALSLLFFQSSGWQYLRFWVRRVLTRDESCGS